MGDLWLYVCEDRFSLSACVDRARRLAEGVLILLLVAAAFALVCQGLGNHACVGTMF
jgi:hypothetical protein